MNTSFYTVVDHEQGTAEWKDWRKDGITATDIPVLLGVNPYKSVYTLTLEKSGLAKEPNLDANPNVQRGNRLEPIARDVLDEKLNDALQPYCVELTDFPVLRASLDGLSSEDIPYEIKAPSEKKFEELQTMGTRSDTYRLYEAQVKAQCVTVGAKRGVLFFYMEDGRSLTFDIDLTTEDLDAILDAAHGYWDCLEKVRALVAPDAPPMDAKRLPEEINAILADANPKWAGSLDIFIPQSGEEEYRYRLHAKAWNESNAKVKQLKAELKLEESIRSEAEEVLKGILGDYKSTDYGGLKITHSERKGSIDWQAAAKAKGVTDEEAEACRRPPSDLYTFTASKEGKLLDADAIGNEATPPKPKRGPAF